MSTFLGPPPKAKTPHVSKVMKSNKAKDTKPELLLRKALWKAGVRGYRLNMNKVAGRPDICFYGRRIAIFVNGCFWHRCPHCKLTLPRSNTGFWRAKFTRNVERDKLKTKRLIQTGWKVFTAWECQIKKSPERIVKRIQSLLIDA